MKVRIYVGVDDHQPRKKERWAAYIIEAEGHEDTHIIDTRCLHATENNAVITMMIAALDRFTRPADIEMWVDSAFVVRTAKRIERKDGRVMNDLDLWQENAWKTARGTEVKNRAEWQRLYNKLRVFEQSRGTFIFEELEKDSRQRDRILRVIESEKQHDC